MTMVPSRPCSTAGEPAQFVFVARGQMFRLVGRPTGIGRRFVAVASAVDRSCWRMRGNLMAVLHGTWPLIFCGCAYVLCCFCGSCRRLMPAGPPCALLDFGLWCTGVAGIDGWVACCPAGLERTAGDPWNWDLHLVAGQLEVPTFFAAHHITAEWPLSVFSALLCRSRPELNKCLLALSAPRDSCLLMRSEACFMHFGGV